MTSPSVMPVEANINDETATVDTGRSAGLLISCEHGGNRVPSPYSDMFARHRELLKTHRGFDAGALVMARDLSSSFGAPLLAATVTRLLVDLNRSVGSPTLHFQTVQSASAELRQQIIAAFHQPYRQEFERRVGQTIAEKGKAIHISSHSFTPELGGKERRADIGLLYDPGRPDEAAFCAHWKACLKDRAPALTVRRNYPYAGKDDGLTTSLRRRFPPSAYLGIELELNQKHVTRDPRKWAPLRQAIVDSLRCALVTSGLVSSTTHAC